MSRAKGLVTAALLGFALVGCSALKGQVTFETDKARSTRDYEPDRARNDYPVRPAHEGEWAREVCAEGVPYYLTTPTFAVSMTEGIGQESSYSIVIGARPDGSRRFEVRLREGLLTSDKLSIVFDGSHVVSMNSQKTDQFGPTIAAIVQVGAAAVNVASKALAFFPAGAFAEKLNDFGEAPKRTIEQNVEDVEAIKKSLREYLCMKAGVEPAGLPDQEVSSHARKQLERIEHDAMRATVSYSDKRVGDLRAFVKRLEDAMNEATKARQRTSLAFGKLRAKLNETLAAAIEDPTKQPAFWTARNQLVDAVKLILEADDALHGRALVGRREALVKFLTTPILGAGPATPPLNADQLKNYAAFVQELQQVLGTLDSVLPAGTAPSGASVGNAVKSRRIDDEARIKVYRARRRLGTNRSSSDALKVCATVRLYLGFDDAVFLVEPQFLQRTGEDN